MTASRHLFISYASDDQAIALEVCALLEARGVSCWIAPRDVTPGAKWDETLLHAIDEAGAFLLLLSTASNDSPFVQNEVNRAFSKKKPIFTFRIEDVTPAGSLEFYLARHHWTDGFGEHIEPQVAQLASSVVAAVGASSAGASPVATVVAPPSRRPLSKSKSAPRWRSVGVIAAAMVVAATMGGAIVWMAMRDRAQPAPVTRFRMMLGPRERLDGLDLTNTAFAPDGRHFVYVAIVDGRRQLHLGSTDALDATPISGTDDATSPFFSPDGKWVGFFTEDAMKKVPLSGGPPVVLARGDNYGRGASWGADGTIVFTPRYDTGLFAIPDSGGMAKALTTVDPTKGEGSNRFPHHLPDGRSFIFTEGTGGSWDDALIEVMNPDTGARKVLVHGGSDGRYLPTGHLVYTRSGALMAAPFDLARLEVTGPAVAVVNGILGSTNNTGALQASVSPDGTLLYVPGGGATERRLAWVEQDGSRELLDLPPRAYRNPRISPDGQRIALDIDEGNKSDIWVFDVQRGTLARVTFDGLSQFPSWTPDGRRVTFQIGATNASIVAMKNADGSGTVDKVQVTSAGSQRPGMWSPDGSAFVFNVVDQATGSDLWTVSKDLHTAQPLLQTRFNEMAAVFSPDGHWLAYQSDESGRAEIYAQAYPGSGMKVLVSSEGGTEALWSLDGKQLFYRSGDRMMAVPMTTSPALRAGKPSVLFEMPAFSLSGARDYDVTRDGKRFVMITENDQVSGATHFNIVLNWFAELRRTVPVK